MKKLGDKSNRSYILTMSFSSGVDSSFFEVGDKNRKIPPQRIQSENGGGWRKKQFKLYKLILNEN